MWSQFSFFLAGAPYLIRAVELIPVNAGLVYTHSQTADGDAKPLHNNRAAKALTEAELKAFYFCCAVNRRLVWSGRSTMDNRMVMA